MNFEAEQRRHSGALYGHRGVLIATARRIQCRWSSDGRSDATVLVPITRLDDMLAALETDGHRVQVRMAEW